MRIERIFAHARPMKDRLTLCDWRTPQQTTEAKLRDQLGLLELTPERRQVSPHDFVEADHNAVRRYLSHDRNPEERHLSSIEVRSQDPDAFRDYFRSRTKLLHEEGVENGAWGLEFHDPQPRPEAVQGLVSGVVRSRCLEHEVDLFPEHPDSPLPIKSARSWLFLRKGKRCWPHLQEISEHLEVEAILVLEVMGQEGKGATRLEGDHPHAGAVESVIGKAHQGSLEQGRASVKVSGFHAESKDTNTRERYAQLNVHAVWVESDFTLPGRMP